MPAGFAAADALASAFQRREGQPGLAYTIIASGALVHSGGLGHRWLDGPEPDAGTVFRIASMTKSFTAAAVLALRDDGALTLDDPAEGYVPELRGLRLPTPDSPPLSLRHLLTMTAGFPTDDPWGDRQQGLPLAEFAEFLRGGVSFAWAPGTRFEYSNMGYAILGRVISAVSGTQYSGFVRERLLLPLGMTQTGFEPRDFDAKRLARGYRRDGSGWSELVPDPCGAFAPMGGAFSCVTDLARWVAGFAAAFPPGEHRGGEHPLPPATRREMQLPQVALPAPEPAPLPGGPGWGARVSYGFGLFVEEDPAWGRIVQHSGGYPGFGSHMRWHPATGLGVVVLANSTYAAAPELAGRMLDALLRDPPPGAAAAAPGAAGSGAVGPEAAGSAGAGLEAGSAGAGPEVIGTTSARLERAGSGAVGPEAPNMREASDMREAGGSREAGPEGAGSVEAGPEVIGTTGVGGRGMPGPTARGSAVGGSPRPGGTPALAPGGPWQDTLAAREVASELLRSWDDGVARRLFAGNVALDEPLAQRRRKAALLRERIGDFADDPGREPDFGSPARCRWWLRGERGVVQAEIQLSPERPPRVQSLSFAIPPAAGSPLAGALESLVSLLNSGAPGWPPSLVASPWLDAGVTLRQLRMAAAWAGRCLPNGFRAGDGETEATLELDGEHGRLTLAVTLAPAQHELHQVEIRLLT